MRPYRQPVLERFWAKVDVLGPDDCWRWSGRAWGHMSYGVFDLNHSRSAYQRTVQAHAFARSVALAEPLSLFACHHCDDPLCCNPTHVYAGSHAENMRDKVARGRAGHGYHAAPGEAHHAARLSQADVEAIRALRGVRSQSAIAEEFGVSQQQVSRIQANKRWRST